MQSRVPLGPDKFHVVVLHVVRLKTTWFTQQKLWGLYQNKVTFSLAAIQRPGHRQATNNPSHANASAAVPTHFNLPDHSIEDMTLIPLELQPTLNTSRRKAREVLIWYTEAKSWSRVEWIAENERWLFTFFNVSAVYVYLHL